MTTYSESNCPFKGKCPYYNHEHTSQDNILDEPMNDKELDELEEDLKLYKNYGTPFAKDMAIFINKKYIQSLLKQAELRGELKTHNRYEIVPIKNLRSHMVARKKIIEAERKKRQEGKD